jgi:hypothetical protein
MTLDELKEQYFGSSMQPENITSGTDKFHEWNSLKESLDILIDYPRTKRRQVWWCIIGKNIGHEQSCDKGFERPVLVIKAFGGLFWGLPITSSDPEGKKERNPLYYKLEGTLYTDASGVEKTLHGFVALHQLRVYDGRRLKRKILKIDSIIFDKIIEKLKQLL